MAKSYSDYSLSFFKEVKGLVHIRILKFVFPVSPPFSCLFKEMNAIHQR